LRLGFRYEGLFRQAVVYKGRSRDTAWFSVIDSEWPALRRGFERWLDPANFDTEAGNAPAFPALEDKPTAGFEIALAAVWSRLSWVTRW
jgi:hypothetical protein